MKKFVGYVEHGELLNEIQRWFLEETRLGIPVDLTMLNRENKWVVAPGTFEVHVATSSALEGVQLQGTFKLR